MGYNLIDEILSPRVCEGGKMINSLCNNLNISMLPFLEYRAEWKKTGQNDFGFYTNNTFTDIRYDQK